MLGTATSWNGCSAPFATHESSEANKPECPHSSSAILASRTSGISPGGGLVSMAGGAL